MNRFQRQSGFSLTEVLMAVGILAMGLIFIAGVFPAGIHFSTIASERTIGAIIADEAFAKIRLVAADPCSGNKITIDDPCFSNVYLTSFREVVRDKRLLSNSNAIDPNVFAYPSKGGYLQDKKIYWSALCRNAGGGYAQVTVFVNRRIGTSAWYYSRGRDTTISPVDVNMPEPVCIAVDNTNLDVDELAVDDQAPDSPMEIYEKNFIGEGSKIVDDETGQIYEVVERYDPPDDYIIRLDRRWDGSSPGKVWVVPPPVDGGRNPCIAVYQRIIKF